MWQVLRKKAEMPTADRALPGRKSPGFAVPTEHFVNHNRLQPPFPAGLEQAMFGLGCFWGAERVFWQTPGVYATSVGYASEFSFASAFKRQVGVPPGRWRAQHAS